MNFTPDHDYVFLLHHYLSTRNLKRLEAAKDAIRAKMHRKDPLPPSFPQVPLNVLFDDFVTSLGFSRFLKRYDMILDTMVKQKSLKHRRNLIVKGDPWALRQLVTVNP